MAFSWGVPFGGSNQYGSATTWVDGETAFSISFTITGGETFTSGEMLLDGASIGPLAKTGLVSPFSAKFRQTENPTWSGLSYGPHTWAMSITTSVGTYESDTYNITVAAYDVPNKATNPTPAHGTDPGTDFSDYTLTWENGGGATSYDVIILSSGTFSWLSQHGLTVPYVTLPESGGTLTSPLRWRVDSINEYGTTTGDEWVFDPRPAKVTNPYPADMATEVSLNLAGVAWDASAIADTYNVYFNNGIPSLNDLVSANQADVTCSLLGQPLPQSTPLDAKVCTWRVDSNNVFGTTVGDEWSFLTLVLAPPFWIIRNAGTGALVDPADYNPDTDYITGENFMTVVRRLVAAAKDAIYYEGVL
jgi:hypothetical protein